MTMGGTSAAGANTTMFGIKGSALNQTVVSRSGRVAPNGSGFFVGMEEAHIEAQGRRNTHFI